jgi:ribonucleoside-diphosphate reductase alpha chain
MLEAVQPFIDGAISKTVNVPADYPYEAFRDLYKDAWRAGLKGLATYRPNDVTGSVLSVGPAAARADDADPLRTRFDSRPPGELESVTSKVEYTTQEGRKAVYLTVSFMRVEGRLGGQSLAIERPFEFFMPASQRSDGHQWITSTMRLLSLAARAGSSIARALADMRAVVWEKGPVRCGFLDAQGNQVPAAQLDRVLAQRRLPHAAQSAPAPEPEPDTVGTGAKCPECGARTLRKVDGCTRCTACHYLGGCA